MTDKKLTHYEFDRLCYPIKVYFCPDKHSWKALIKSLGGDDKYPCGKNGSAGTAVYLKNNDVIVCLRKENRTPTQYAGLMIHELMHVVQQIEKVIYPYDQNGRLDIETQCYLMQGLSMWALDALQDSGFFGSES